MSAGHHQGGQHRRAQDHHEGRAGQLLRVLPGRRRHASKHNLTLDGYGADDDRWVGAARADRLRGALVLVVGMLFLGGDWGLVWFLKRVWQMPECGFLT